MTVMTTAPFDESVIVLAGDIPTEGRRDGYALAEAVMRVAGQSDPIPTDPGPEVPPPLRHPRPGEPPTPIIPEPILPDPLPPQPVPPQPDQGAWAQV